MAIQLDPIKTDLLTKAFTMHPEFSTFADLGACWGVHGGYAKFVAETFPIKRVSIVDQHVTPETVEWVKQSDRARTVSAMLGSEKALSEVGDVDAVAMFDILLHQVSPDWDQLISMWATKARCFILHNPMWTVGDTTLRFPDHGIEWFKANVIYTDAKRLEDWFRHHNEFDKKQGKLQRDVHNFWQFGITQRDMLALFEKLGYRIEFLSFFKKRRTHPWIQNYGYIFHRR